MKHDARSATKRGSSTKRKKSKSKKSNGEVWNLRLYIAGRTQRSSTAIDNLQNICREYLQDKYSIEVIDLLENPRLAIGDQIIAVPTLVRKLPEPMRKIIGDLSNSEHVLIGLDLKPSAG